MAERARRTASAARVFAQQPERVAAAWRRVRCAQAGPAAEPPQHLLDGVVEPFVRELGRALGGELGSPWERTGGVLRLSRSRGLRALYEEFEALRRCLGDALGALGAGEAELALVQRALDDATDSCAALQLQLFEGRLDAPPTRFGGVVIEVFDPAAAPSLRAAPERGRSMLH